MREGETPTRVFCRLSSSPLSLRQVYTEGGEQKVDFQPGVYQTLQIVQGSMSLASALLFLGRDTFCVSKRIQVNRRPAHQLCYDWAYGMRSLSLSTFASEIHFHGFDVLAVHSLPLSLSHTKTQTHEQTHDKQQKIA